MIYDCIDFLGRDSMREKGNIIPFRVSFLHAYPSSSFVLSYLPRCGNLLTSAKVIKICGILPSLFGGK